MAEPATKSLPHISGLDSIRFVAALAVLLGHLGVPPSLRGIWPDGSIGWAIRSTVDNSINGQAAVMVFFVISGFCIHYPRVEQDKLGVLEFLSARYLRIIPPMTVAISIWMMIRSDLESFTIGILWSLYAELFYYTCYPLLRQLRKLWGWGPVFGISVIGWAAVILSQPAVAEYPSHGVILTSILGSPCWLLGCILAERLKTSALNGSPPSTASIWAWRLFIWLLSVIASVLEFHSPIGAPITLNIFAVAVFFWLEREILRARVSGPVASLE